MSVMQSRTVISDATGEPIDDSYQVGIIFDNTIRVIDVDRRDLVNELGEISLLTALLKGRRVKRMDRNSRTSLTQTLHNAARKWAMEQGIDVGRRGVVSKDVLRRYREAHDIAPIDILVADHVISDEDPDED